LPIPGAPVEGLELLASDAADTTDGLELVSYRASLSLPLRSREVSTKRYTTQFTELDLSATTQEAMDKVCLLFPFL